MQNQSYKSIAKTTLEHNFVSMKCVPFDDESFLIYIKVNLTELGNGKCIGKVLKENMIAFFNEMDNNTANTPRWRACYDAFSDIEDML